MKEPKEEMSWESRDVGIMKVEREIEIPDEKGVIVGSKTEVSKVRVTAENIEQGMAIAKERIEKSKDKIKDIEKKIKVMGKIPATTGELIRLKKNLVQLSKIEEGKKGLAEINSLNEQMLLDEKMIATRKKLFKTRPKK